MHRLLADSSELEKDVPSLSREAARHLAVVRPRDGEEVELFDGRGALRTYAFSSAGRELRAAGPLRRAERPYGGRIVLFACVTKGQRWEWTVEKATELGASRIVPVLSGRTVVKVAPGEREAKRERWERIAAEAARQSDAAWLPEICAPVGFAEAAEMARRTACFAGALVDPPARPLAEAVAAALSAPDDGREYSVFVGPEGDFTAEELSALLEFAAPTSFGPTVLRAETAAVFGVSVLAACLHGRRGKGE